MPDSENYPNWPYDDEGNLLPGASPVDRGTPDPEASTDGYVGPTYSQQVGSGYRERNFIQEISDRTGIPYADVERWYGQMSPAARSNLERQLRQRGYGQEWDQLMMDTEGDIRSWFDSENKRAKDAEREAKTKEVEDALDAFWKEMSKDLDLNDPNVKRQMLNIAGMSKSSLWDRGIRGSGMAEASTAKAVSDASLGLQQQRKEIGARAMSARLTDLRGLDSYKAEAANLAADKDYADKMDRAMAEQAQRRGLGQGVGAGIGSAIGALGFLAGPAGPVVGPLTMAAGGALGGAIGGAVGQGGVPYVRRRRTYGSGGMSSRGGY